MAHQFALGRGAGLLLPLSSARGPRGNLGSYADAGEIARWLVTAGCNLWQLLPLNEVSPGQDSPYAASSSCALEPVYIDLDSVEDLGPLTDAERAALAGERAEGRVDFGVVRDAKRSALQRAFEKFRARGGVDQPALRQFREGHRAWIEDWALYRALHDRRQKSWREWEPGLRDRDEAALAQARGELGGAIDELVYVQWLADQQWRKGRAAANAQGVQVLGDLPFMVAEDSADVWSFQRFFRFDATVGVPPDAYSADGQDWGLPVPHWDEMRAQGDPWLHLRADRAAELYDAFRVDHVVGLYRTYARPLDKSAPYFVPGEEPRQKEQGERILALLGEKAEVLAEDLGTVPDFVRASLAALDVPGTKVLRWENDRGVPRDVTRFPRVSVAVTGTHDTESLWTWWESLPDWEREQQLSQPQLAHLRGPDETKYTAQTRAALLDLAYAASSAALLTPITDALGWADRMNTPGTVGAHNWTFRLPWTSQELFSAPEPVATARELAHLAVRHGRGR
ncbi:MAG TPA: 4-alpha-glucanotransferase [Myxococcales bacterium]|nr:4-alpha-glucanotransferase [Myxococcales bacterium]